ncbi:hypothetical protein GC096_21350 [Paenibacillus sp. LMG 31461]|uniref:Uncharacterized protein n=1 Tax=Paenibacillus plantarum TaxID=2654975 RepID=A0ABX1XE51_9BACL|nr:hypothetical protein [Paenibacillus plantarum]NOU66594.1 hypothetical protein [Paenibacillus plantarum]
MKVGCEANFALALAEAAESWQSELREQGLLSCSIFARGSGVFLYFETASECCESEWEWPTTCKQMLETWPGDGGMQRYSVPMLDIYHDGEPEIREARENGGRERIGMLARLKPSKYSSYIFYHYALQEEKPSCFNPTYIIGAYEDLIFSYQERPSPAFEHGATRRKWPAPITPENWHDIMQPHFVPWSENEQGSILWETMDTILSF